MALPARLKRLLKSSPATVELAAYLESEGVEETPAGNDDSGNDDSGNDDTGNDDSGNDDG